MPKRGVTMARVLDVAQYILEQQGGSMTTMKLQKLVYYSQAWNLVWDGVPLYSSPIQAWANGPVVPELYNRHRGRFTVSATEPLGDSSALAQSEKETIDAVLSASSHLSGQQLSDITHGERPWIEARAGIPEGAASQAVVNPEVMQDYFGGKHGEQLRA